MSDQVLTRLKNIVSVHNGATPKSDNPEFWDGDIAWATPVDLSTLKSKYLHSTQRKITNLGYHSCNTKLVEPGNIVISNRAPIGLVAINKIPVCTNQGCKVLILNKYKIDVAYLYYYLLSIADDLQNLGTGTTFMEISSETLKNITIPVVPLPRQKDIAERLDKKIATIDKMIAAKNRTRTHLAELRTAIITKAVLGQGSSNNLQQTNIPWIGEVPAHWTVRKLKDLATISIGWTPSTSNPEYFEGDNIWVTIADMNKKHISESKNRVSDVAIIDAGIKKVPKGSLLYSFKLSVGKVAFAGTDLYTNEAIAAIIPRNLKQIDNKFLYYALSTYLIDSANENIYGAKLLNQSLIKNAYIALPPIDEQKQIATELNRKLTKLDRTMVKTTNSLELLKEYRSSLISNVITGKVAV